MVGGFKFGFEEFSVYSEDNADLKISPLFFSPISLKIECASVFSLAEMPEWPNGLGSGDRKRLSPFGNA